MPIQVVWQAEVSGAETRQYIVLPHAQLLLTLVGDVIVDTTWQSPNPMCAQSDSKFAAQLLAYLSTAGGKPFQVQLYRQGTAYSQMIWQALLGIPFGLVVSYSALAAQVGSGPRAVAQACRSNPYPGIIPCHRVVAKSGIGGFMGQKEGPLVHLKQQLLTYERQQAERGL